MYPLTSSYKKKSKIKSITFYAKSKMYLQATTKVCRLYSCSGPGILYGLPKIHETNFSTQFQFRPIFAA